MLIYDLVIIFLTLATFAWSYILLIVWICMHIYGLYLYKLIYKIIVSLIIIALLPVFNIMSITVSWFIN